MTGDADVAPGNPKVLHFHIADGLPERAVLYLRGGTISSLWYSELARHGHRLAIASGDIDWDIPLSHTHSFEATISEVDSHKHGYQKQNSGDQGAFRLSHDPYKDDANTFPVTNEDSTNAMFMNGGHHHDLTATTIGTADPSRVTITPDFEALSIDESGIGPGVRPGQRPYSYFKELKVKLDGTPVTEKILEQVPALAQLGVGESTTPDSEPFVTDGTSAIDLMLLGVDLLPGAHKLEFVVPDGKGGGKLFHELYID